MSHRRTAAAPAVAPELTTMPKGVRPHHDHKEHPLQEADCLVCHGPLMLDTHCGCRHSGCTCKFCRDCGLKYKYNPPRREVRKRSLHH